jgi:hypothetical protein
MQQLGGGVNSRENGLGAGSAEVTSHGLAVIELKPREIAFVVVVYVCELQVNQRRGGD